jgi:hypothetical protein
MNQIIELAARNSLPSMSFGREFPVAGGLRMVSGALN